MDTQLNNLVSFLTSMETRKFFREYSNFFGLLSNITRDPLNSLNFLNNVEKISILMENISSNINFKGKSQSHFFEKFINSYKFQYLIELLFKNDNIKVASLPIYRIENKTYTVEPYEIDFDDYIAFLIQNKELFVIYMIEYTENNKLIIRGNANEEFRSRYIKNQTYNNELA